MSDLYYKTMDIVEKHNTSKQTVSRYINDYLRDFLPEGSWKYSVNENAYTYDGRAMKIIDRFFELRKTTPILNRIIQKMLKEGSVEKQKKEEEKTEVKVEEKKEVKEKSKESSEVHEEAKPSQEAVLLATMVRSYEKQLETMEKQIESQQKDGVNLRESLAQREGTILKKEDIIGKKESVIHYKDQVITTLQAENQKLLMAITENDKPKERPAETVVVEKDELEEKRNEKKSASKVVKAGWFSKLFRKSA